MTPYWEHFARIKSLKPGWDGYGAPPITLESVRHAEDLLPEFVERGFGPKKISTLDGGVCFIYGGGAKKAYVAFGHARDVRVYLIKHVGDSNVDVRIVEENDPDLIVTLLKEFLG